MVARGHSGTTPRRQGSGGQAAIELGNGERHEWIDWFCGRLARVHAGRQATHLLSSSLPANGNLAILPMWVWLPPRIDVGRKARRRDGSTAHLPVRLSWEHGPVMITEHEVEIRWSLAGMGYIEDGSLRLPAMPDGAPPDIADQVLTAPHVPRQVLAAHLQDLADDGAAARWELLLGLEPFVRKEVDRAAAAVRYELAEIRGELSRVLDGEGLQRVVDRMLLGDADYAGRVGPLLDRCLDPGAFRNVDPLRHVAKDLHRSAQEEVRKAINDPRAGRRIRLLARTMPGATAEEIAEAYGRRHPYAPVSATLVASALWTGPDPMANRVALGGVHGNEVAA